MKINWGKSHDSYNETELSQGDFEALLKQREKTLPKLEKEVSRILGTWHGQSIAIVLVHEDENGEPDKTEVFISGVGRLDSSVALSKGLSEAADKSMERVIDASSQDPKALLKLASLLMDEIKKEIKEK